MQCADCQTDKPLAEFPKGADPASKAIKRCRLYKNALSNERIRHRWGNTRHYHLRQRYGLSAAEVDVLKASQGGVCAVCGDRPAVHVDHDHTTRRVRGILCELCNGFLGAFNDDPALIRAAIDYLERP